MVRTTRIFILTALIAMLAAAPSLGAFSGTSTVAFAQGGPTVVVNTGALHVRSGPSFNTSVLGTVPGGTELSVTGRNANGVWWRVSSPFGTGWVRDDYVVFRGQIDAVPIVSEPVGTPETPMVVTQGISTIIYSNPNRESFVLGVVSSGTIMTVLGGLPDESWWQVQTTMGVGWVETQAVAFRGDTALVPRSGDPGPSFKGPAVRVNADSAALSVPGGSAVSALAAGSTLSAIGRTADNTWWQVTGGFGSGWIPVSNVSVLGNISGLPVASQVTISGPGYTGASFAMALVAIDRKLAYNSNSSEMDPTWDARLGDTLSVIARSPNGLWLQVIKGDYTGWMDFSGLTLQGTMAGIPIVNTHPPVANVAIVNTHRLFIRSGPGVEYQSLTSVSGGTTLSVTGVHPTLPWLRVQGDYGTGWVRIMYIIFRGNWDAVPLVTDPVGGLEMPLAIVGTPHHVYSQPAWDMPAGTIQPDLYTIVGRTRDFQWALIQTPLGEVWISFGEIEIRGIVENAPVRG